MLKNLIITSAKQLFTNRAMATLSVALLVLGVAFSLYIAFVVQPSDLQLVTHYSAYGVTHLYRSQWWYLLSFGAFGLLVAALHVAIALKIFLLKGHPLAVAFLWFGIGVVLFAWVVSVAIVTIWSPVG